VTSLGVYSTPGGDHILWQARHRVNPVRSIAALAASYQKLAAVMLVGVISQGAPKGNRINRYRIWKTSQGDVDRGAGAGLYILLGITFL